jgi:hypothetical protein
MYQIDEANRQVASLNQKVDRLSKELLDAALLTIQAELNVRDKERTVSGLSSEREGSDRQSFDGVPEWE